jgi:hypothetical protein
MWHQYFPISVKSILEDRRAYLASMEASDARLK